MPVKVIWDYTFYWALLAQLYFAGRQCDIAALGRTRAAFQRGGELNVHVQALLREWGRRNAEAGRPVDIATDTMLDQSRIPWFAEMNRALNDPLDDAAFVERIHANLARMEALAAEVLARARAAHPGIDGDALEAALAGTGPDAGESLAPRWYQAA